MIYGTPKQLTLTDKCIDCLCDCLWVLVPWLILASLFIGAAINFIRGR